VTLAIALVLFAGFVAVLLVSRRRKHHQATVPPQRTDPPADPAPAPDPEPTDWPPTR
jgi:hypothetical protein